MIVFNMALKLSFLSILLSICISVSSIMCAWHVDKPYSHANSGESNIFNIEKPGLAIVEFSSKSISSFAYSPDSTLSNKLSFKFWLLKKLKKVKNTELYHLLVLKIIYVYISINAP